MNTTAAWTLTNAGWRRRQRPEVPTELPLIYVRLIKQPKRRLAVTATVRGKQAPFMSVSRAKLWVAAELAKVMP